MLKKEKYSKFVSTYHYCGIARLICPNYFKLKSKNGVSQSRTRDHDPKSKVQKNCVVNF